MLKFISNYFQPHRSLRRAWRHCRTPPPNTRWRCVPGEHTARPDGRKTTQLVYTIEVGTARSLLKLAQLRLQPCDVTNLWLIYKETILIFGEHFEIRMPVVIVTGSRNHKKIWLFIKLRYSFITLVVEVYRQPLSLKIKIQPCHNRPKSKPPFCTITFALPAHIVENTNHILTVSKIIGPQLKNEHL